MAVCVFWLDCLPLRVEEYRASYLRISRGCRLFVYPFSSFPSSLPLFLYLFLWRGSLDPLTGRAAYAWVLTNEAATACAKSANDIWTNPKYMSSFRAKLEGVHDMLTYARKVCTPDKTLEI